MCIVQPPVHAERRCNMANANNSHGNVECKIQHMRTKVYTLQYAKSEILFATLYDFYCIQGLLGVREKTKHDVCKRLFAPRGIEQQNRGHRT